MADVRGGLPRLLAHHRGLWVDEAEGIDDDLALHRLNRVDHDGDRARVQRLKALWGACKSTQLLRY